MLYVSDFFTRHKEAVSNQLELLASHKSGQIVAATRFMNQKAFSRSELKDGIYIVPPFLYPAALAISLLTSRTPVHVFEEESFGWKRFLLNLSGRPLYISLYRRPEIEHIEHLRKYKHLKKIFVELPVHKELLIGHGFDANRIALTSTPSKLSRRRSSKQFDPSDVNIVFASWNTSEANALHDRGVLYLIDLLAKNPEYSVTIPLRDSHTDELWQAAKSKGVANRINLLDISNTKELEEMFDRCDFVAFVAQDRVVKDVPNSIIDGLVYGKPAIVSDVLDFCTVVAQNRIGYVIKAGERPSRMKITAEAYRDMSERAYKYSARHTPAKYKQSSTTYGVPNENRDN